MWHPAGGAVGPWDGRTLHGGAVAGLLAHLVESTEPSSARVVRLTVDLLGPVPSSPLESRPRVVRQGRKVQLVDVELRAAGIPVARASGLRLRPGSAGGPDNAVEAVHAAPPEQGARPSERVRTSSPFFEGIEFRVVEGVIGEPGPVAVWCRVDHRWLAGEAPSDLVRAAAVVDSAYGYGLPVSTADWLVINIDTSIHLHRAPKGEWLLVDAATELSADGIGVGRARLADRHGSVGTALQSLVVSPGSRRRS